MVGQRPCMPMKSSLRDISSFTGAPACLASMAAIRSASWFWFLFPKLPHVLRDHANFLIGNSEIAGDVVAAVGDAAGRRVDRQLVAVPLGHGRPRLHLRVVHESGAETVFKY